jgi:hypothetical protein
MNPNAMDGLADGRPRENFCLFFGFGIFAGGIARECGGSWSGVGVGDRGRRADG